MYLQKTKEMFAEMVVKKNAGLIPEYYHQEFLLYANGTVTNYEDYLNSHQRYYAEKRIYEIAYDEDTLFEQGDKVAMRVWITITIDNIPKKIEVILILQFKEEKIYRIWELTYPDWTKMSEFN